MAQSTSVKREFDFNLIPSLLSFLSKPSPTKTIQEADPDKLNSRKLSRLAQVRGAQAAEDAQELGSRKTLGTLPPSERKAFQRGAERDLGRPLRTEPVANVLTRGTELGGRELLAAGESSGNAPGFGLKQQEAFLGTPVGVGRSPQEQARELQEFGIPSEPGGLVDRTSGAGFTPTPDTLQIAQTGTVDVLGNQLKNIQIQNLLTKDPKVRENLGNVAARTEELRLAMAAVQGVKPGEGVLDFSILSNADTFRKLQPKIANMNNAILEAQRANAAAGLPPLKDMFLVKVLNVGRSDVAGEKSLGTQVVMQNSDPTQISQFDKIGVLKFDKGVPSAAIQLDPAKVLERLSPRGLQTDGITDGPEAPPEIQTAIGNRSLPAQDKEFALNFADTIAGELVNRLGGDVSELDNEGIALALTNLPIPVNDPRYQALSPEGKVAVADVIKQYLALTRDVHKVTLSDELGPGDDTSVQELGQTKDPRKRTLKPGGKGVEEVEPPTFGGEPEVPVTPTPDPRQPTSELNIRPSPGGLPRGQGGRPGGLSGTPAGAAGQGSFPRPQSSIRGSTEIATAPTDQPILGGGATPPAPLPSLTPPPRSTAAATSGLPTATDKRPASSRARADIRRGLRGDERNSDVQGILDTITKINKTPEDFFAVENALTDMNDDQLQRIGTALVGLRGTGGRDVDEDVNSVIELIKDELISREGRLKVRAN